MSNIALAASHSECCSQQLAASLLYAASKYSTPPSAASPKFAVAANVSNVARAWNEFRYEILRAAITQHLFPIFEREVKQRLLAEAKEVAMNE